MRRWPSSSGGKPSLPSVCRLFAPSAFLLLQACASPQPVLVPCPEPVKVEISRKLSPEQNPLDPLPVFEFPNIGNGERM